MSTISAQSDPPGERRGAEFDPRNDEQDAQHTLTLAPFDASLPNTVAPDMASSAPDVADTLMTAPDTAQSSATDDAREYNARRRQVLTLAGGAGAALLLMGKARTAHADGFLFDVKTERTALRVADELLDMSVDFFGRGGNFVGTRPSERQANALNLVLGQDREVSALLKLAVRQYRATDGGIAMLPNATAIASPRPYSFPPSTFKSAADALTFGSMLKDTIVGAFHGVLLFIKDPELLGTAAAIAGVQSRHAALIREAAGTDPFPAAFETALDLKAVSDLLAPYGFTGGAPLS